MMALRSTQTFAIVFAVAYAVLYLMAVEKNWALFTYHPALGKFCLFPGRPQGRPEVVLVGLLATSGIGAFAIATLASLLPKIITDRIGPIWSWSVPLLVMFAFVYLLRTF